MFYIFWITLQLLLLLLFLWTQKQSFSIFAIMPQGRFVFFQHCIQNELLLQSATGANTLLMTPKKNADHKNSVFAGTRSHGTTVSWDLVRHVFLKVVHALPFVRSGAVCSPLCAILGWSGPHCIRFSSANNFCDFGVKFLLGSWQEQHFLLKADFVKQLLCN